MAKAKTVHSSFVVQSAKIEVLEITAPDKMERRKRGKNDTNDAESAAHAAFSRIRTVTPKTRSGMIEALRILKVCRKTAVAARRIALQMIQMNILSRTENTFIQCAVKSRPSGRGRQLPNSFSCTQPLLVNRKILVTLTPSDSEITSFLSREFAVIISGVFAQSGIPLTL